MTRNPRLLTLTICLSMLLGGAVSAHARVTRPAALTHIREAMHSKLHRVSNDAAMACDLQMGVSCDANGCTSTTTNVGTNSCAGEYFIGFFTDLNRPTIDFSNFTNSLGITADFCFDSSDPELQTDQVFDFCFGDASLAPGASFTTHINVTRGAGVPGLLPVIGLTGVTDTVTDEDLAFVFASNDTRTPTCTPFASVPAITQSGSAYDVTWSQVSDQNPIYQIDESTSANFSTGVTTSTVQGRSKTFQHSVNTTTTYYYRVRSTSCGGSLGPNSETVSIVIQSNPPQNARNVDTVVPAGSTTPVSFQVFVPGTGSGKTALDTAFTAVTDKPYLSVSPSSGTIPPGGTTLTVTANPKDLPPGANTGTLSVTSTSGTPVATVQVSISLVAPVGPSPKSLPSGDTLIIPVVTHVNGATSPFQSDVRLTNAGTTSQTYLLTFTPTRTDATLSSKGTTITVTAGQTIALNDIAKDFFGFGASGSATDVGFGSLEIRPVGTSSLETYASSRTYATTSAGTLGQFIAAVPFFGFIGPSTNVPLPGTGQGPQRLSLQQIAQSTKFRTNLGIVEGSGNPASGTINVFDDSGALLKSVPYSLLPGEHQQINAFLAANGIASLDDGRIEITVDSPTGAVTAYASVLDNITTDPLAVQGIIAQDTFSSRYVLPGMADLNNGAANFHSDIRIYNAGRLPQTVNLTYFPQQNVPAAKTATPITIAAGEVKAIDNVLPSLFGATNTGGSILVTTADDSALVATGRTYSIATNGGTYGQFIPGITPDFSVPNGGGTLQILQLEQSNNFRSNVGLAETTGNPVRVRCSLILPDSKVIPFVELDMAGNEFRQLNGVIGSLNPGKNTYNARITVQVIGGTGKVTAYGSVIDNATQDPTYVPAQ